MKIIFLILCCFVSISFAQEIADNPLRMVGTNVFDFTPLIQSFLRQEITNSVFLVSGRVTQVSGYTAVIVHNELRNQLTDEFKKQMLLVDPAELLKMTYATELLDKWRKGQFSTGEFMSLDSETKDIISDEIQREKEDYIEVRILAKNIPQNYLVLGKQVQFLALPITARAVGVQSQYDYGNVILGDSNSFTNKFFVTVRGYIKQQIPKKNADQTNEPAFLQTNSPSNK